MSGRAGRVVKKPKQNDLFSRAELDMIRSVALAHSMSPFELIRECVGFGTRSADAAAIFRRWVVVTAAKRALERGDL